MRMSRLGHAHCQAILPGQRASGQAPLCRKAIARSPIGPRCSDYGHLSPIRSSTVHRAVGQQCRLREADRLARGFRGQRYRRPAAVVRLEPLRRAVYVRLGAAEVPGHYRAEQTGSADCRCDQNADGCWHRRPQSSGRADLPTKSSRWEPQNAHAQSTSTSDHRTRPPKNERPSSPSRRGPGRHSRFRPAHRSEPQAAASRCPARTVPPTANRGQRPTRRAGPCRAIFSTNVAFVASKESPPQQPDSRTDD